MRAMPHRVATRSAVAFAAPRLLVAGGEFHSGEPVVPWDYLAPATVVSSITVDEEELLRSTGLAELSCMVACVQVDCPTTGLRLFTTAPLPEAGATAGLMVPIGAHQVAQRLEVTQSVLLDRAGPGEPSDRTAFRRGSRLWQSDTTFGFILEGSASTFPTEAFDFTAAGLPPDSAWKLQFEPASLDEPYLGAVRLLLNAKHPEGPELLTGRPSLVQSVLFHSIVEQLLTTVVGRFPGPLPSEFDADSVGEALNHLTMIYLGVPLAVAASRLRNDRAETLCQLQAGTAFLLGGRP